MFSVLCNFHPLIRPEAGMAKEIKIDFQVSDVIANEGSAAISPLLRFTIHEMVSPLHSLQ